MSLPFLPIASERSPSRRPRECRAPPPTRGFPTKTQAAASNHLGSSVLDHPAPLVVRLARSPGLCSGGHCHPLAAPTVSQVLGHLCNSHRRRRGRPATALQIRQLIARMVMANPLWRAPRIHGELKMLGIAISERTVSRLLRRLPRPPSQTWKTFLHNHLSQMVSIDFFTVPTLTLK